jgi:hypothetical protein
VKESNLDSIPVYTCLFEKVSNLESISISTMCYIISMKNMAILMDLSHFRRTLHKIEGIDIFS